MRIQNIFKALYKHSYYLYKERKRERKKERKGGRKERWKEKRKGGRKEGIVARGEEVRIETVRQIDRQTFSKL